MSRKLGIEQIMSATQAAIWGARAGSLASLDLKVVDEGAFDVPAPEQLATQMNQVIVSYGRLVKGEADKPRKAYRASHEIHLHYVRQLGELERPEVALRQGAEKLADLFSQGDFLLPGYTPTNGVHVELCYVSDLVTLDGFPLGEDVHAEQATVSLFLRTTSYEDPFPI